MKVLICLILVLVTVSTSWSAVVIRVTTDPEVLACANLVDDGVGVKTVYVVVSGDRLLNARFSVTSAVGATLTYVGETHYVDGTSGSVPAGITICAPSCLPLNSTILSIDYMSHGTSGICSEIRIVPAAGYDGVDLANCAGTYSDPVTAYPLHINEHFPDCSGLCDPAYHAPSSEGISCETLPVEGSTWGSIKALYD